MLIIVLVFGMASCAKQEKQQRLKVITTIYPYEMLIKQIVGDKAEVVSIIPNNVSPHSYSPTPDDLKQIERANLVFSNGFGLEVYLEKVLSGLNGKHLSAEGLIVFEKNYHQYPASIGEDEEHHTHRLNPHVWLDLHFLEQIAYGILGKMSEIDPDNLDYYIGNTKNLIKELDLADSLISEEALNRSLNTINFHDSFYYFNQSYGIKTVAVIASSPGKEPTPREISKLGELIKDKHVNVIFLEPQLNPKAGEIIAEEYGISLDYLDPLGDRKKISKVSELILDNWAVMSKYLK
jgi:zinc transport system substrate-binding protein